MMTHRNLVRDGMTLPIQEALKLEDDKGNPIKFELTEKYRQDPFSGSLPSYYYEDTESKKVYSLNIEVPYNLVTVRINDISEEQKKQKEYNQSKQSSSKTTTKK